MDDIAREFIYRGYGVDGRQTLEYRVFVIPAGNLSVSRDYSNNEAKMVNFSVVVVGDGRTCASGDGKVPEVERNSGIGSGVFKTSTEMGVTYGDNKVLYKIWQFLRISL